MHYYPCNSKGMIQLMLNEQVFLWGGFTLFVLAMLALDLGVFHRKPHHAGMKEALFWVSFWIILALIFNLGIVLFYHHEPQAGLKFFTGFLVEKSLSIDNIFVFILIFEYFRVPQAYQHKVLFWGIIGAIILRALFILGGLAVLKHFHWSLYIFGGFLLLTGTSMMFKKKNNYNLEKNWLISFFKRFFPMEIQYKGNNFFIRKNKQILATPLFFALLAIESADIIFAIDSIPAIFAITSDPFIVYTSNIFALLGLRALYFALSEFMSRFYFLHYGFASIIIILAIKMLLSDIYQIPILLSLAVIIFILFVCIIISLLRPRQADLKILFERIEHLGLVSFRRLLMLENILDLSDLKVYNSMQARNNTIAIRLDAPWNKNKQLITEAHFTRYPLIADEKSKPIGILHVQNLLFLNDIEINEKKLRSLVRPYLEMKENLLLEDALRQFQRNYEHMAIVVDSHQKWIGIICIEDILEEIVGRIGDEFDTERRGKLFSLADALSPGRILFDLETKSMSDVVVNLVNHIPKREFPIKRETIIRAVSQGSAMGQLYVGSGLAILRGRVEGINQPLLAFARTEEGIPVEDTYERIDMIFLLLTPRGMARMQAYLLADIIDLQESDYVMERLHKTNSPQEVIDVIRAGQQIVID